MAETQRRAGFTLIELIVVLAIVTMLLTLAVPRYFSSVERSKEAVLKQNLVVMREAVQQYYADKGRYPDELDTLVRDRYLRNIPVDPITESASTWAVRPPPGSQGGVYDVHSGASGASADGVPYREW